jgi:hypothetical protein
MTTATGQNDSLLELCVWLGGIAALALMEPDGAHLFSFCPYNWVWAEGCWGCGLGHGIAYMFRGAWQASWQAHPLAGPAIFILLRRCVQLLQRQYLYHHTTKTTLKQYHG